MKKIIIFFFAVVLYKNVLSQPVPLQSQYKKYYIQFTDKNNSPYSIANPSAYLSPRAITRRVNQNIPIDSLDLPVNPAYIAGVASTGAIILNPTKWLNGVTVATNDSNVLLKIKHLPFVQTLAPASVVDVAKTLRKKTSASENKNSNASSRSASNSGYNYGNALNQIEMINGTGLHNEGYQGQGMVIASLDDGFTDANIVDCFDSLRAGNRILGWHDFVSLVDSDIFDLSTYGDHGCQTLSTMAAFLPGQIVGTAPEASYWLLRTENDSSENPVEMYNWVSGAEFADSVGADIITSSLGYSTFDDDTLNLTYANMNGKTAPCSIAAGIAATKGIIVCNSAGNEGAAAWHYITAPGDADSIITVGAVEPNGNYAPFSGVGPTSDGRLKPTIVAQGDPATVINPESGNTTTNSGTSFSCPIIAGMTACLWQKFPKKTNMQIIQAVEQSASLYANPNYMYGNGIPDYGIASVLLSLSPSDTSATNQSNEFYVFPNPFSSQVNLIYYNNNSADKLIQIYDMLGRLVYNTTIASVAHGINNYELTGLNQLSHGMYILMLSTTGSQQMVKIVKL